MTKIITKLWMGRVCLISVILSCSLFMCQNTFSFPWNKRLFHVKYDKTKDYYLIYINFALYHYESKASDYSYLSSCDFSYSTDGKRFKKLISVASKSQNSSDRGLIIVHDKRWGENIRLFPNSTYNEGIEMPDDRDISILATSTKFTPSNAKSFKGAYLGIYWKMLKTDKLVNFIEIDGSWFDGNLQQMDRIKHVSPRIQVKSNSNSLDNDTTVLKSELSNNVKVHVETDAINVTGVEPGENIKVYTSTGVELKSLVATDDAINIQLPMNQIYIVNAGQTRYKVAL